MLHEDGREDKKDERLFSCQSGEPMALKATSPHNHDRDYFLNDQSTQ